MSVTASQLNRLMRCPASNSFPGVMDSSSYSADGVAIHAFLENVSKLGRDAALALVPEDLRPRCARIPCEDLPVNLSAEVPLALDLHTGRARICSRRGRQYDVWPNEWAGTADVVGRMGEVVFVADWKTGPRPVAVRDNWQLAFYAVAAARLYDASGAVVEVIQIDEDGEIYRKRIELDLVDLDDAFGAFVDLRASIEEAESDVRDGRAPSVREGDHCNRCPSFVHCPAKVALVKRMAHGHAYDEFEAAIGALDIADAGRVYLEVKRFKRLVNRIERQIYAIASERPIPLPGGEELRLVTKEGNERIDGDIAWSVISSLFDRETADRAVGRTASKAGLKRALDVPRKELERIVDAIREAQGIARPMRESLEVVPCEK